MDRQEQLINSIETYKNAITDTVTKLEGTLNSILDLLKPRVLTLEEALEWKDSVWVEEKNGDVYLCLIKRIFEDRKVIALYDCSHYYTQSSCEYDDYNRLERFWSAKPTPLQQEITKWDE